MKKYIVFIISVLFLVFCSEVNDPNTNKSEYKILYRHFYNSDQSTLFTIDADGSDKFQITPDSLVVNSNSGPSFDLSNDGTLIAFTTNNKIYTVDIHGNNLKEIPFDNPDMLNKPVISHDNQKIIITKTWARSYTNEGSELYILNIDGSEAIKLYTYRSHHDFAAQFSKDGNMVLFQSSGVCLINIDGTNFKKFTDEHVKNPKFLNDGTKIAYINTPYNNPSDDIIIMDLDGSNKVNITNYTEEIELQNLWPHPDGNRIIYRTWDEYFVINIDGSGKKELSNEFPVNYRDRVSISSDGKKIITSSYEGIAIMDLENPNIDYIPNTKTYNESYAAYPVFMP